MYAVAVRPPGWAGGARRQGDWGAAPRIALASGAPLYTDSPDRIAAARMHDLYWAEPEPSVPQELERAVLFLLPDADSVRTDDAYLEIDSEKDGEVWVGWFPDETRNYVIAREWLDKALTKDDCDKLKVRRLRAWTFARAGEFEEAYEAFRDLHLDYAEGDSLIGDAMKNFLLERIYHARRAGDEKGVETWFRRLQADFPSWMMSPEDAVREAAGRGMGNLMLDN